MKEKRDESVEELAQKLESRISRKEEEDDLEEILLDEIQEESFSGKDFDRSAGKKAFLEEEFSENTGEDAFSEKDFSENDQGNDQENDLFEEDDLFEEEDFSGEDEDSVNPWVMAAAMAGIVVLAAIICAILWHFTHLEQKDGGKDSQSSVTDSTEYAASDPVGTDGSSGAAGDSAASIPASEATASPEPTPAPTVSPTPTASSSATPAPAVAPTPAAAQTTLPPTTDVQEPVSGTTAMEFTQNIAEVTPKDVINLRSEPSTLNADNIVAQAKNGEILNRTGINEATGWTRLDHNGEILYAVSQYLTTDLTYRTPVQASDPNRVNTRDGRIILFTDCSDDITPKEYVNLRTEPSTSEGESTVRCQISNGEVVHRTGYSPDAGWSRVEYNGEVLYVVSSYMYTVQP